MSYNCDGLNFNQQSKEYLMDFVDKQIMQQVDSIHFINSCNIDLLLDIKPISKEQFNMFFYNKQKQLFQYENEKKDFVDSVYNNILNNKKEYKNLRYLALSDDKEEQIKAITHYTETFMYADKKAYNVLVNFRFNVEEPEIIEEPKLKTDKEIKIEEITNKLKNF